MHPDTEMFRQVLSAQARRLDMELTEDQVDALSAHYELLVKWNARVRLVATTDPARCATELFGDSLVVAQFVEDIAAETAGTTPLIHMLDIGAGTGLPGVALKTLLPRWELTCIESNAKKVSFIKSLARELRLDGVRIIRGRAEELAHGDEFRGQFDVAFCRAVAAPAVACELAVPFLKVGGSFIAQTGEGAEDVQKASELLGATLVKRKSYRLEGVSSCRVVARVKKFRPTPPEYPREVKRTKRKPLA